MTDRGVETRAIPIEQVVSLQPFIVQRRIAFRDCDPAGIVYTPRFLDPIATSAVDLFMGELIGLYGQRDEEVAGLDLPAKAVNLVFHSPARYGDLVNLKVFCSGVGNTTFELGIAGAAQDGTALFDATLTLICVAPSEYRSIPVPEYVQQRLKRHREI